MGSEVNSLLERDVMSDVVVSMAMVVNLVHLLLKSLKLAIKLRCYILAKYAKKRICAELIFALRK